VSGAGLIAGDGVAGPTSGKSTRPVVGPASPSLQPFINIASKTKIVIFVFIFLPVLKDI